MKKKLFFLTAVFIVFLFSACFSNIVIEPPPSHTRVAAYIRCTWGNWSADQIQGEYLTDIILAFTNIDSDFSSLTGVNDLWSDWNRIEELKKLHPHLRIHISVGGWSADYFSQMSRDETKRKTFITNCINLIKKRNLDGIDIDWEYPVGPSYWYAPGAVESPVNSSGNPITVSLQDRVNYIKLLEELRSALNKLSRETKKYYYLSTCVPADEWFISRNDVIAAASIVDSIKLMAYDYSGSWTDAVYHANLHPAYPGGWSTSSALEAYLKAGVPAHKIMMGMPTYGKEWKGVPPGDNPNLPGLNMNASGVRGRDLGYSQTIKKYLDVNSGFTRYWDDTAKQAILYNPDLDSGTWVCYPDKEQIELIIAYSKEKGLNGFFYWEWYWDQDADLLSVMHKEAVRSIP